MGKISRFVALALGCLLLLLYANMTTLAGSVTQQGVTLTTPNTHSGCSTTTTFDTITSTGLGAGQQLIGWVSVQYVTPSGRVPVPGGYYAINTSSNLNLRVSYPPSTTWPSGEIHVDLSITLYQAGVPVAVFGPGQDWDVFCTGQPPAAGGCTFTQGYYKNHPAALPATLTVGGVSLTRTQLVAILESPVQGNGAIALAHQLITAEANVAGGATAPAAVQMAIAQANTLLTGVISSTGTFTGTLPPAQTSGLTETLTAFNEGVSAGGPAHCSG